MQIATNSDIPVLPPSPPEFVDLRFSPDGDYIYFVRLEPGITVYSSLHQIPTLGGTPSRLVFDIDSGVSFSPDGRRIAFIRQKPREKESTLMIADADGTNEHELVVLDMKRAETFETVTPAGQHHRVHGRSRGTRAACVAYGRGGRESNAGHGRQ